MAIDSEAVSKAHFKLVYDGPALQGNEMAVRDLSAALLAADALFMEADAVLNGGRAEARLTVEGSFKTGCFGIDFNSFIALGAKFKGLFASDEATAVSNAQAIFGLLVGAGASLFALLKWRKGRQVTKVETRDGRVRFFIGEKFFDTEMKVLALYRSLRVRQALEDLVATPLQKEGIDSFAVFQKNIVVADAQKDDAVAFIADVAQEEQLEEVTRETWLNIVSAAFQQGDKWRVNDGGTNFFASLNDADFILKVLKNEVEFGAATRLKVRLRETQWTDRKGILKKDSFIEKVIQIHKPLEQMPLSGL